MTFLTTREGLKFTRETEALTETSFLVVNVKG